MSVGVGVRQPKRREMEPFGVDYNQRRALFNEVLDIITALWSSETVTYNGEFYTLDEASISVSPASDSDIYIASAAFNLEDGS